MMATSATAVRAELILTEYQERNRRAVDRFFIVLMAAQFLAGIVFALVVSPRAWPGSQVGPHFGTAMLAGGLIAVVPILLAWRCPGRFITRCVIAAGQMLASALLIHLSGGRIEAHFHLITSLAFLSFYRDWRVFIPATTVVGLDHVLRGSFWPESIYGVHTVDVWRSMEHAGWIAFETLVLVLSCIRGVREMRRFAQAQAEYEAANSLIESRVEVRTRELAHRSTELAEAKSQVDAILHAAGDAIITIDERGIIRSFNNAAERMLGYTMAEAINQNVRLIMPEPDRSEHDKYLSRYLTTREKHVVDRQREVVARRKDGLKFPVELRVTEVNVHGKTIFTGILHDLSRRKEAEAVQWERETCTALVADVAVALNVGGPPRAVLQKCAEGIVKRLDAAFARIWTLDAAGTTLELQASAGMYTHIDGPHGRVPVGKFKIGRIAQNRRAHLTNDVPNDPHVGDHEWARRESLVSFAGYPLIVDEKLVGVVALFSRHALSDSTLAALGAAADNIASGIGRKQAEERLAQTQMQLVAASRTAGMAEIATGVLHNVGNVLNSVNVSAAMVKEQLGGLRIDSLTKATNLMRDHMGDLAEYLRQDERGKHLPGYLVKLAEHMAGSQTTILGELDALGERIDHIKTIVGTQQSYASGGGLIESLSLKEVLEDAVKLHAVGFDRHRITLVRRLDDVPPVQADRHRLLQILHNLLTNARQSLGDPSVESRTLFLTTGVREDGQAFIEIRDTGVGVAPENLTRIFAHGFTTKKNGHGFGLHSSANAAKELGGSLTASSDGAGLGAAFVLSLPVAVKEVRS